MMGFNLVKAEAESSQNHFKKSMATSAGLLQKLAPLNTDGIFVELGLYIQIFSRSHVQNQKTCTLALYGSGDCLDKNVHLSHQVIPPLCLNQGWTNF